VDLSQTDAMIWLMSRPAETTIACGLERLGLRWLPSNLRRCRAAAGPSVCAASCELQGPLNPQARIVARLFDQDLAERAQHQLGINACHSVSALATPAFVAAALGDGMLSTIEHGDRLWLLAELTVEAASNLDGLATRAVEQPGSVHVLAVRESAAERWRPAWPEQLLAGHDILVACRREGWERLRGWARREA
jgi:hypothetical protein